jgi:hypothetical protein
VNLAEEARWASAHPADPARICLRTATVPDLAGADAEVVFVAGHVTTIGSQNAAGNREMRSS